MSNKQLVTVEQALDDLAAGISAEVFKIFQDQATMRSHKYARQLSARFLSAFITRAVCEVLTEKPKDTKSDKQRERYLRENFASLRLSYEEAIAVGFQAAMTQFSGQSCEYYCLIKTVPNPVNRKPC